MSVDIDITVYHNVCKCCGRAESSDTVLDLNYTHNMGYAAYAGFKATAPGLGIPPLGEESIWKFFRGKKCSDVLELVQGIFSYICAPENDEALRAKEPDNGWGNLDSYRKFWGSILYACEGNPEGVIDTSY